MHCCSHLFLEASAASDKKKKKDKKRGGRHEYKVEYANVGIPLLDTRSIFVLQAKVGDEFWTLKKDVEVTFYSSFFNVKKCFNVHGDVDLDC